MRQFRPNAELPAALVDDLHQLAGARGTTMAVLFFHWVVTAAQLAERGQGHLLPQERRAARNSLGEVRNTHWPQGRDSYDECRTRIRAAGSSVVAVLRTAGEAYRAAGGDEVAMDWPPKSALAEAA